MFICKFFVLTKKYRFLSRSMQTRQLFALSLDLHSIVKVPVIVWSSYVAHKPALERKHVSVMACLELNWKVHWALSEVGQGCMVLYYSLMHLSLPGCGFNQAHLFLSLYPLHPSCCHCCCHCRWKTKTTMKQTLLSSQPLRTSSTM